MEEAVGGEAALDAHSCGAGSNADSQQQAGAEVEVSRPSTPKSLVPSHVRLPPHTFRFTTAGRSHHSASPWAPQAVDRTTQSGGANARSPRSNSTPSSQRALHVSEKVRLGAVERPCPSRCWNKTKIEANPLAVCVPLPPSHQTLPQLLALLTQLLRRDLAPQPTVPPPEPLLQQPFHPARKPSGSGWQ